MNDINRMGAFPSRLKAARELRRLSQSELSEKTHLQISAISHFETGARKPSFDNLKKLADALEVTTDYLLGRVEKPNELADSDTLYRHISKLDDKDKKAAEEFVAFLAKKKR